MDTDRIRTRLRLRPLAHALGLYVSIAAIGCAGDDEGARDMTTGATGPGASGGDGGDAGDGGDDGDDGDGSGDGGGPDTDYLVVLDLAGHAVDGSPHFRVVDNFNANESITVAVDPTRHGLAGSRCDLYVVASRSQEAWVEDPTLSDVRGAPDTVALVAGLADNRFEIGTLPAEAGAKLGVAYDVVLDCDRDGRLGAADAIDGGERPGLWVTHDASAPGPYPVTGVEYSGGSFLGQRTFHPANIADLGELPLVVVTHGWSYNYTYYDYIGEHLASYGYVVMHHEANVQDGGPPGTISAAQDTLANLDYLLANLDTIGDGVLAGHVDARRIMLTGHSTGGEAVVRALTQLREGSFASAHFGVDDIRVVSSMAPVSWHPRSAVDPGTTPYHMFVAGADDDVSGAPLPSYTQCRSIFERARGDRHLTYIHGAGHGDLLDCCGELFLDQSAPDLIGREATKRVAQGYLLALAELYLRDNEAGREFFTRPFGDYHPSGIAPNVVVTNESRAASAAVVLDDFESSGAADDPLSRSSAGTEVNTDVGHAAEVLMRDNDGSLAWTGEQPSNGMTQARHEGDDPHALVFDFAPGDAVSWQVQVPADADVDARGVLSLRACQGTRHPETVALGGPLSFAVALRDEAGETATIRIDGARAVPAPYARAGEGEGVGWANEMVTVRVRLADFLGDNPQLDLDTLAAVRLDFGEGAGSDRGRLGLDDVELLARP